MEQRVSWQGLKSWDTNIMLNAAYAIEGARRAARNKHYKRYAQTQCSTGHQATDLEALFLGVWEIIKERDRIDRQLAKYSRYGWTITASGHILGMANSRTLANRQRHLNLALEALLQDASRVHSQWRCWLLGMRTSVLHYS